MSGEKHCSNEMQKYVMHLRYRLAQYQFHGIVPPAKFLAELKMAQRLADLELEDNRHIDIEI